MAHEYKTFDFALEVLDYEGRTVEGYAAVFGNIDLGDDIIHRGAFAKTLAERGNKVKFLWQHNTAEPLGRVLQLNEDERGLFFKAVISDTARGRDALALLRDGAISGMSIGYDPVRGGVDYSKDDAGHTLRNLREVRLWEVSLATMPMNEAAGVTALKEDADAEPEPEPEPAFDAEAAIAELKGRIEALETKLAPADEAGRVAEPLATEAGPDVEPPTSEIETALKELALLLKIS